MTRKMIGGAGLVVAILLGLAAPAAAHVTTDPASAPQGSETTVRFRVPNEVTAANVVKLDVAFPTDHPLLGVVPEPVAGWSVTVAQATLNPPVQTDDGPVSQAVNEIVWTAASGAGTPPGQFQEFPVLVQQLPTTTGQVVFKAIQTYGDGSVVRWIDPVVAGQPAPDHPTPILKLTAGDSSTGTAATPGTTVDVSRLAQKNDVSSANTLATVGIVVGALGLLVALAALLKTRRSPAAAPAAPE